MADPDYGARRDGKPFINAQPSYRRILVMA
jgi:hypothetical protein